MPDCVKCGRDFAGRKGKKYCSLECAGRKPPDPNGTCIECGVAFTRLTGNRGRPQTVCSDICTKIRHARYCKQYNKTYYIGTIKPRRVAARNQEAE